MKTRGGNGIYVGRRGLRGFQITSRVCQALKRAELVCPGPAARARMKLVWGGGEIGRCGSIRSRGDAGGFAASILPTHLGN